MSLKDILRRVADESGVTVAQMTGRSSHPVVCLVRHRYCWEARQVTWDDGRTRYSWRQIGDRIGRDHTSAMHSHKRWQQFLDDPTQSPMGRKAEKLAAEETAVLIALHQEAGERDWCVISGLEIGRRTGLGEEAVKRSLINLRAADVINWQNGHGKPRFIRLAKHQDDMAVAA